MVLWHHSKFSLPMSALGQKQTLQSVRPMSALPPKADIAVPIAVRQTHNLLQLMRLIG